MMASKDQSELLVHKNEALDVEEADDLKSASLNDSEEETDWRSIYCTALLAFFTAIQFALYYSSLWPYLQIIEKDIDESFFGYIIGIYSFGQIVGSPLVGFWSNRIKQIRLPLYVTICLMLIGNAIYIVIELVPNKKYWLLLSRLITGFGSSNISLLKAYTAASSNSSDRSRSIAFVTGGIAVGMFLGPAFQLFFIPLSYPGIKLPFGLSLQMYNAPAYSACLLNVICILSVKFFFREHYAGLVNKNSDSEVKIKIPKYDRTPVLICYFTRFTQILANSTLETLSAPLTMALFAWNRHDVVENIALAQLIMSFLAFLTYLLFIVFNADRFLNFRLCCIASLVGLIVFYMLTMSWPFLPGNVQLYHRNESSIDEHLGCDADKFKWCYSLRPVNVVLFYACYVFIIGCSFANINISLNTLFSKIIGPRRQGTEQGVLQVSGGIARMVGPVTMSFLYVLYGPRIVWTAIITVIAVNVALWVLFYKRMVPLRMPEIYSTIDRVSIDNESKQFIESQSPNV